MDENISDEELFMSDGVEEVAETPTEEVEAVAETKPEETAEVKTEPVIEAPETVEAKPETLETVEKVEAKDEGQVPSWRVREINEAKREAEAKLAQREQEFAQSQAQLNALQDQIQRQQQPQTPPNMFDDPDGYTAHQQHMLNQQGQQVRMQMAQLEAKVTYGVELVAEAERAVEAVMHSNPNVFARIKASDNPWAEAVNWHKEQQTQQAIGEGGIDGFRQREREALMADPEFRKQVFETMRGEAGGKQTATLETIPSLNKAPSANTGGQEPKLTDADIFNS